MSERIHCDLASCDKTRRSDGPSMIPDPWIKVEPVDGGYGQTPVRHFCCDEHAALALAEPRK